MFTGKQPFDIHLSESSVTKTRPYSGHRPRSRFSRTFLAGALVAAVLFAVSSTACSKSPPFEDPTLSIKPEAANFGTIQSNDPIAFHDVSLTFENRGRKPLTIETIELPAGFTYTLVPRATIEGGERATARITIDIRRFSGPVSETAYVLSNNQSRPKVPIELKAEIVGVRTEKKFEVRDEPDIEFEHKVINLGFVDRHQTLAHNFEFTNVGKQPLKIITIETFCKCLTGKPSKPIVQPGESAAIVAVFEAYKWRARTFRKALLISTNDPDEPSITLTMVANITDALSLEPAEIFLPNIAQDQSAVAQATLRQRGEGKLEVTKIETSSPFVSATSEALTEGERGYLFTVTVAPDMPEGKLDERVTIHTNYHSDPTHQQPHSLKEGEYEEYSKIIIPVRGSVVGALSITPQTINFGAVEPGESVHRKLFVSSDDSPFDITSLSIADTEFQTSYSAIKPQQKYEITVEFIPGAGEREIKETLTITTTAATLDVPIYATVTVSSD
jgi:hypothetical protein